MTMTIDTQQFVIRSGFVAVLAAMLTSLIALGVLAVVHDGSLANQMTDLYTIIVQQGLYVVGGLVGLHTLVAGVTTVTGTKTPPTPASPSPEPVAGS